MKIKLDELVYMVMEADKVGLGPYFRAMDIEIEKDQYIKYWAELNKKRVD